MSKHTKEPWTADDFRLDLPMMICKGEHAMDHHEYLRAMECVNALAGLNPEAVGEVVEALKFLANIDNYMEASAEPWEIASAALAKLRTP